MSEKLYSVTFNGNEMPADVAFRLLAIFAGKTVSVERKTQAVKLAPVTFKTRYDSVQALANNKALATALQTAEGTFKVHVPEVCSVTINAKNLIKAGEVFIKDLEALMYRRSVKAELYGDEKTAGLVKYESLTPKNARTKEENTDIESAMDTLASFIMGNNADVVAEA